MTNLIGIFDRGACGLHAGFAADLSGGLVIAMHGGAKNRILYVVDFAFRG